jgi:DNA-binding LacI/PurR family transcriptional regulator
MIGDPFWAEIAEGVDQRASESEFSLLFGSGHGNPVQAARMLDVFFGKRVDGIVIAASAGASEATLASSAIPAVFVGWDPPLGTEVVERAATEPPEPLARELACYSGRLPYVALDDVNAGVLATAHLVEHGHRRVAFLGGPATLAMANRLIGGRIALGAAGLDFTRVVPGPDLYDESRLAALDLLAEQDRPTAIVAFNDLAAVGTIRAARELGLQVPDQLSVVGFDDIPLAELVEPPLTTVYQPKRALGAKAVDLLLDALRHGSVAASERMSGVLVERGSTAQAPRERDKARTT